MSAVSIARAHNIADLRTQARRRLPRGLFEFVDRGTEDDLSIHGGEAGVRRSLELLRAETDRVLGFMGCPTVAALEPSLLARVDWHQEPA